MTKTLQDLIDESIFISTEYQARLAELTGDSDWAVDFSAPSFTLQSDPSVSLTPYLLGTESEQRGSWIWAWQELGHFPASVVSAAVQSREAGEDLGVQELATDELILSEGLARRLTLAAKSVTGLYAHYPAAAGGGVRAWLLVDGPQFELPAPTVQRMGRVMAQALQTDTAVHHQRAVDSYARLRGAHIAWDTEACAIITATDGALRLWFDGQRITGIEAAEPVVGEKELRRAAQEAQEHRERLRTEGRRALELAAQESAEQNRLRQEAEARRVAATETAVAEQEVDEVQPVHQESRDEAYGSSPSDRLAAAQRDEEQLPETVEEFSAVEYEESLPPTGQASARPTAGSQPDGVVRAEHRGGNAPFDQDPREDAEPGLVSTQVVPEDQDLDEGRQSAGRSERVEEPEAVTEQTPVVEPHAAEQTGPESAGREEEARETVIVEETVEEREVQDRSVEDRGSGDRGGEENLTALERLRRANAQAGQGTASATGRRDAAGRPAETAEPAREDEYVVEQETEEHEESGRKKGFFSRFFGL